MMDRKPQIENLIQKFHAIKHRIVTGKFILSARNKIPNSQWIVLHAVFHNEGIGIKELSRLLGISSSATTQLVDSLVQREHLIREVDPQDRRALKIKVSKKTKNLFNLGKTQAFGRVNSLFDVLTDEEFQIYCNLTQKIVDNLLETIDRTKPADNN
jgi:DNA-binding MarR family transcriptional regulator